MMNFKALAVAATVALGTAVAPAPAEAFGFGQLIQGVGAAAGVGQITNVVGGVIHNQEVQRTQQMLADNAVKAAEAQAQTELGALEIALQHATTDAERQMIQGMIDRANGVEPAPQAAPEAQIGSAVYTAEPTEEINQEDLNMMMGLLGADADRRAQEECAYAPNPAGCLQIKRQQNANGLGMMNGMFSGAINGDEKQFTDAINNGIGYQAY